MKLRHKYSILICSCLMSGMTAFAGQLFAEDQAAGNSAGVHAGASTVDDLESKDLDEDDILDLELDQLGSVDVVVPSFEVEVSAVTRSHGTVGRSPAAIFVITNEMIRRSGATSLPEVLRLAPGLIVSRVDSNHWAISSRGFSGVFSNKLLVLIDGRTVYSPVFSGVHWETPDIVLENVDRIEVVRGPGASVWGANAVNGVISVITKHSRDTVGLHASSGIGSEDQNISVLQSGRRAGNWTSRIYGKYSERDAGYATAGRAFDDWSQVRAGARWDWSSCRNDCRHFMLSTEFVGTQTSNFVENLPTSTPPFFTSFPRDSDFSGGFVQARWSEKLSPDESYWIQSYYDTRSLDVIYTNQKANTADFEFQYNLRVDQHQLTWGLGYRSVWDELIPGNRSPLRFQPEKRQTNLFSGYVQDEITVTPESLYLIGGCRFEHNSFSGFELQPTLRLLRMIDERRAVWVAGSRAVRSPSRVDANVRTPFFDRSTNNLVELQGSPDIEAENLTAFEVGYRSQPNDNFSWNTSFFIHEYSDLVSYSPAGVLPSFPPTIAGPFVNQGNATFWGAETTATLQLTKNWQLSGWYTFMTGAIRDLPIGGGNSAPAGMAQNQFRLTSSHDLSDRMQFDAMLRYVDSIAAFETPAYTSLDLRLGYKLNKQWDVSVVGQNLLDSAHFEAVQPQTYEVPTAVQRGLFVQLRMNL